MRHIEARLVIGDGLRPSSRNRHRGFDGYFMIETIIFLLLSFICSSLGLNTEDIRTTASTESPFSYMVLLTVLAGEILASKLTDCDRCAKLSTWFRIKFRNPQWIKQLEPKQERN